MIENLQEGPLNKNCAKANKLQVLQRHLALELQKSAIRNI